MGPFKEFFDIKRFTTRSLTGQRKQSDMDKRAGDITREEFHATIQHWLATYRPLRDAHRQNDGTTVIIPFAPGKVSSLPRTCTIFFYLEYLYSVFCIYSSKNIGESDW